MRTHALFNVMARATVSILLATVGFCLGCSTVPAPSTARNITTFSHSPTIAEELLTLEFTGEVQPECKRLLADIIDASVTEFEKVPQHEQEQARADRFFRTVDNSLIEHNVIFPPRGLIDLLRNALTPRSMDETDYAIAIAHPANRRRVSQMSKNMKEGGMFYFADCDLSAILYVAVGQELGLPITFVGVPEHNFVRWASPTLRTNWDSNDGVSYSDEDYAKRWRVTRVGQKYQGSLGNMPREGIFSYWLEMIGDWHIRQGRYPEALVAFRSAVSTNSHDLAAANSLAWFLATCPDSKLRNGKEAMAIAKRVTAVAPRANWLDTLASAQAENGEFAKAVETEQRAKAQQGEWGVSGNDNLASFDECISAYRKDKTYRQGVEIGLVREPKLQRPYD